MMIGYPLEPGGINILFRYKYRRLWRNKLERQTSQPSILRQQEPVVLEAWPQRIFLYQEDDICQIDCSEEITLWLPSWK